MSREKGKNFKRVCLSLDSSSIQLLEDLAKKHNMSKSEFIKFVLFCYQNTYGFTTPFLKGVGRI